MKRNFTLLNVFFIFCLSCSTFGQAIVLNDFETGSPALVSRYGRISNVSVISNPNSSGLNTSANCAKIIRTTANWFELFGFNTSFTIPANTKKYLHMKVNYAAQPDVSIRINAATAAVDGSGDIRAMNKYTDLGNWQDLVFEMDGGATGRTVTALLVLPDLGFNNLPVGRILNETDKFGYIDDISVDDSSAPNLSVDESIFSNSIAIYPNPTTDVLNISNLKPNSTITVNSIDGKSVYNNTNIDNNLSLSVKGWSKGVYVIKVKNDTQISVKKFIVE